MARIVLEADEKKFLGLEQEIKRLNLERAKLIQETNEIIQKNSDLKTEQIAIEKKSKEFIDNAVKKSEEMIANAKNITNTASSKLSTVDIKIANLDEQKQELNKLIKSNEGLEKNLNLEKAAISEIKSKLQKALEAIKEILK